MICIDVALRKESVDRNSTGVASLTVRTTSLSARRAWIEITYVTRLPRAQVSLSARRAWIEIIDDLEPSTTRRVALRKESVDRNYKERPGQKARPVALRKESVDRNREQFKYVVQCRKSLSARRAWIEIKRRTYQQGEELSRSPQGERG